MDHLHRTCCRKTSELKRVTSKRLFLFLEFVLLFMLSSTEATPVRFLPPREPLTKGGLEVVGLWNQRAINLIVPSAEPRRKRELRSSRKMLPSPMPLKMPATYFPFIMAEMLPGSIKTRHPAIIAVNGCPAYYTADNTGRCRQMFQYTFGQRNLRTPSVSYFPPQDIFWTPKRTENFNPPNIGLPTRNIHTEFRVPSPPKPKSLATLLFNVATSKYNNEESSSHNDNNSGEVSDTSSKIDKLRERILSLLKIKEEEKQYFEDSNIFERTTEHPSDSDD